MDTDGCLLTLECFLGQGAFQGATAGRQPMIVPVFDACQRARDRPYPDLRPVCAPRRHIYWYFLPDLLCDFFPYSYPDQPYAFTVHHTSARMSASPHKPVPLSLLLRQRRWRMGKDVRWTQGDSVATRLGRHAGGTQQEVLIRPDLLDERDPDRAAVIEADPEDAARFVKHPSVLDSGVQHAEASCTAADLWRQQNFIAFDAELRTDGRSREPCGGEQLRGRRMPWQPLRNRADALS
jgi:hypothetical protein